MTAMNSDVFKITAIIAIYNEEDIIAEVVDDLIGQGIYVYILDDGSTDNSLERLKRFCDSGLLTIEIFRPPAESSGTFFEWESILRRKEELARKLDSDWFIHADADEFRESPFPGMSLAQGIRLVDRLGYNAIDFAVINFYPVEGEEIINEGIRQSFLHYEYGAEYDRLQIKCWKKQTDNVDLVAAGGHQAVFPERKVFPIRFILRHYPLRGREHARKKVFTERLPRLKNNERFKGWHVQYDKYDEQSIFVRRAEELERYEPDKVRALLMTYNRELEALKANLESIFRDKDAHIGNLDAAIRDKDVHIGNLDAAIRDKDTHVGNLEAVIRDKDAHIGNLESAIRDKDTHIGNLETAIREKDVHIGNLESAIRDKDAHIGNLESFIRDKEAHIGNLESVIRDKEAHIGNLDAVIRDKDAHIGNLESAIRDKDAHIGNLDAAIRDMDVQIGNLDTHTKNLEADKAQIVTEKIRLEAESAQSLRDIQELKCVVQEKNNRINALENSLSWKITEPLRLLYSLIKIIMK